MTAQFWKKFVVKKVIIAALILIAGVALGILTNYMAPVSVDAVTSTALEQAQGRSAVDVMATSTAFGGFISIGRIVAQVLMFLFIFVFCFDTSVDIYKIAKKTEEK